MTNKSHRLLLGHSFASESGNDCDSRAVEGKVRKADSPKKTVPVACSLRWHVVSHLPALFLHFAKKRPQSRDKRGCVATTSLDRERNFVRFDIDILEGKARFAKAAALPDCDLKRDAHPGRLRFEFVPYQRLFFQRYLMFFLGVVGRNAKLRTRIDRGKFPRNGFEHDDAPNTNVEQGTVETNRTKSAFLRRILTPFEILNDVFSFQLARALDIPGFQERADGIPSLLVFRKSVLFPTVARLQKREDPSIKVFFVRNAGGISLFLTSLGFELARLGGFRANANATASRLVADFSSGISKLYPPIRGAVAFIDGSHKLVSLSVTSVTNFVNLYLRIPAFNQVYPPSTLYS